MTKTESRYIVQENERDEHGDVADLTVFKTLKEAIDYAFYMKRLNGDKYKISIMFVEKNESNFEPEELNSEDFDWKNFFDPTVVWEGDEAKTCDFCGRVSTPERIVREYPQIIGWTEAQELNARGWEIILSGRVRKNLREVIRIKPNTDELTFNETVREFIKNHYDNEFKAYKY